MTSEPSAWTAKMVQALALLPSMNYLEYQFTIEDPKVLTKPWTSAWRTYSLGKEDLAENFCNNNETLEQLRKLAEIEAAKRK